MTDVHDPMKEKLRKKHNRWEVTAATPPLIEHGASQMLSLDESLKLQENYFKKLKVLYEISLILLISFIQQR